MKHASAVELSAACTIPTRRSFAVVSDQSAAPLAAVGSALSTPSPTSSCAAGRLRRPPIRSSVKALVQNPMGRSVSTGCTE